MYDQLIYNNAIKNGMPANLAKLIVAQAKLETNNYSSAVFKANNNLFGYKFVGQSIATKGTPAPKSEGDNYAKYKNLENSVLELCNWIKRRVKEGIFPADLTTITTPAQYAALLKKKGYFGVSVVHYANGLQRYFRGIAGVSGLLIAVVVGLWFFLK